jgi:hypothetical protein
MVDLLTLSLSRASKVARANQRSRHPGKARAPRNRQRKKAPGAGAFRICQRLFRTNRRRLAEAFCTDVDPESMREVRPPYDALGERYSRLWGETGCTNWTGTYQGAGTPLSQVFQPITPGEVDRRIHRIKPSSSPGLDGITALIRANATSVIAKLNLLLITGRYPASWRRNSHLHTQNW